MRVPAEVLLKVNEMVLVGLLGTPMLLFLSLFFFDDPTARGNPLVWAAFLATWAYPVVAYFAARRAIKAYREGDVARLGRLTWASCSLPGAFLLLATVETLASVVGLFVSPT